MFTAFVMIQAEPNKIAEIARSIANMPNVAEVYSVTGDFDILVVLRLSEFEQLAESVPDGLSRIDGILRTNTQPYPGSTRSSGVRECPNSARSDCTCYDQYLRQNEVEENRLLS